MAPDRSSFIEFAEEPADWDGFVLGHPWGAVYHLTAWKRVIEEAFGHIKGGFLVLRSTEDSRILAGLPLYTVRSWLLGGRLVSVPFASFCDPLVSDSNSLCRLVAEANRIARAQKVSSLEIRLLGACTLARDAELRPTLYSKHHFAVLAKPLEDLWGSFSKTSVRQCVQRAEKAGVSIVEINGNGSLPTFLEILSDTRSRLALPIIPNVFFEAMVRHLGPDCLSCWIARDREGRPLSGLLAWRLGEKFCVEYAGDFPTGRRLGANQLLYWQVMRAAREMGCKSFSFGRTDLHNVGLLRYKRHWGAIEENLEMIQLPEGHTLKGPNRDQSPMFRFAKLLLSRSPAKLQALIGRFCYRHLG